MPDYYVKISMIYTIRADDKKSAVGKAKELLIKDLLEEEFIEDVPDKFEAKVKKIAKDKKTS